MNAFVRLNPEGVGYELINTTRPGETMMYIDKFTMDSTGSVDTEVAWEDYSAAIVGFEGANANQDMYMLRDLSDGMWYVKATATDGFVHVLFIHRSLCTDDTATTQA